MSELTSTRSAAACSRTSTATAATATTRCTGSANIMRAVAENLTDRQRTRLESAFTADERHVEVEVAWRCAQQVRSVYDQDTHAAGRAIAQKVLDAFASCPIPEAARLGKTLRQWREAFLGYFETAGASNGRTEAVNGLIE